MVREWQPFNGLQTYYNWRVGPPDSKLMVPEALCEKGLRHVNVSCVAPGFYLQ
ncbi:hypothetical protein M885DRAFT_524892 [Pelagophyceae sp. CCMP2097]|nr:hypothetical protein M885DRAFT_524892 [Pelagophyceae sp. CCMP2097]